MLYFMANIKVANFLVCAAFDGNVKKYWPHKKTIYFFWGFVLSISGPISDVMRCIFELFQVENVAVIYRVIRHICKEPFFRETLQFSVVVMA